MGTIIQTNICNYYQGNLREQFMTTTHTQPKHVNTKDFNFTGLLAEISDAWQRKAESLQARRWRKLGGEFKPKTIHRLYS